MGLEPHVAAAPPTLALPPEYLGKGLVRMQTAHFSAGDGCLQRARSTRGTLVREPLLPTNGRRAVSSCIFELQ